MISTQFGTFRQAVSGEKIFKNLLAQLSSFMTLFIAPVSIRPVV
jgi:hypothetical protein